MQRLFDDIRYASRQLIKTPNFTLLVILAIGLGIGANTAIFSMINGYLRPLPIPDPDQIVVLAAQTPGDQTGLWYRFSLPALQDYRAQAGRFSSLFGFNVNLAGFHAGGKPTQFLHSVVTGNFFTALGLKPAAGRLFLPGEGEASGSELLCVLGYSFWQRRFGGDPSVVGREVRLDGRVLYSGASRDESSIAPRVIGRTAGLRPAPWHPVPHLHSRKGLLHPPLDRPSSPPAEKTFRSCVTEREASRLRPQSSASPSRSSSSRRAPRDR